MPLQNAVEINKISGSRSFGNSLELIDSNVVDTIYCEPLPASSFPYSMRRVVIEIYFKPLVVRVSYLHFQKAPVLIEDHSAGVDNSFVFAKPTDQSIVVESLLGEKVEIVRFAVMKEPRR